MKDYKDIFPPYVTQLSVCFTNQIRAAFPPILQMWMFWMDYVLLVFSFIVKLVLKNKN